MSPGSVWIGSIQSTSFIPALQRGHAGVPCLFSNSDTNAFQCQHDPNAAPSYRLRPCALFSDVSFVLWDVGLFWGFHAIRAYLDGHTFDAETIRQMGIAFEMGLVWLRAPPGRDDPIRKTLAQSIIALAQLGERDPERLCESAGGQVCYPVG